MSLTAALEYLRSGLCVLPAQLSPKKPMLPSWKPFQKELPSEAQVRRWFRTDRPMCILTGKASGNLEIIDFDCQGVTFEPWRKLVSEETPGLFERLVIERSQSGGFHVIYRCEGVGKNMKLAERIVETPDSNRFTYFGKEYEPRFVNDRWQFRPVLIETRGEGGLFICAPTPGYELTQGSFSNIPVLTEAERELLLEAAWSLNEVVPEPEPVRVASSDMGERPGDDYNQRGDVRELLEKHGWGCVRGGDNEHWRRPGKREGWSATLKDGVFYVFSSSAHPFEPNASYKAFSVYARLEHGGDYSAAASALRLLGYGGETREHGEVVLDGLLRRPTAGLQVADIEERGQVADPGPIPEELLFVPGFVADVMEFTMATAPYPNRPLAFAGALSLQAVLTGRKIREPGNLRTNLQILALAHSGVGKDWPRKVSARVLLESGEARKLAGKSASGEAIEDRLMRHPVMLKQDDEIDTVLANIRDDKEARFRTQLANILELFGEAGGWRSVRDKAGREDQIIHQPHLVIFGTTTPNEFFESLSSKMLKKGLLARFNVLEAGSRPTRQPPRWPALPEQILETARWWSEFRPSGWGNLSDESSGEPFPLVVPMLPEAVAELDAFADVCDTGYRQAEARSDEPAMAIWARAVEKATQLALVYACSACHESPQIDQAAIQWAARFVQHGTLRTLYLLGQYFHESEFEGKCQRVISLLTKWAELRGDKWMPFRELTRKLRWSSREHDEITATLIAQELVEYDTNTTSGRPKRVCRLLSTSGHLLSKGTIATREGGTDG